MMELEARGGGGTKKELGGGKPPKGGLGIGGGIKSIGPLFKDVGSGTGRAT